MYASLPKLGVFTSTAMENYRSLDAHRFFKSGWVQTVYHKNITPEHVVFMADVRPSYRVTEQPHHPLVAVSRDACVQALRRCWLQLFQQNGGRLKGCSRDADGRYSLPLQTIHSILANVRQSTKKENTIFVRRKIINNINFLL